MVFRSINLLCSFFKINIVHNLALGLPNFDKLFHVYYHAKDGIAAGFLGETFASQMWPGAYFSCQSDLDLWHQVCPVLDAVATSCTLIDKTSTLILDSPVTSMFPAQCLFFYEFKDPTPSTGDRLPMSRPF